MLHLRKANSEKRMANIICYYTLLLLITLLLTALNLSAQNPYIQHYTTSDGLQSNTVYYIYQDSQKFIWFATDAGVSRYDGTIFTNYRKKDGLNSNEVIRIKEDSFGRLWFFNLNGRLNFFYQNRIFNEKNAPFLDSIKNKNFFIDFYEDPSRAIYFYGRWYEIFSLDKQNKVSKHQIDEQILNFLTYGDCRYLSKNAMGDFILWTWGGIFKLNSLFRNPIKIFDSFFIGNVNSGRNKSFYISAYGDGVIKLNDQFKIDTVLMPFKMDKYYSGMMSILEDADGLLWIVTFDKGVFCVSDNQIVRHLDIKEGEAIIKDHENNIWISSMKDGVYKISHYLNTHRHYENTLFQNTGIIAMDVKPGTGLWFTNGKLVYLLKKNIFFTLNFPAKDLQFNQVHQMKNDILFLGGKGSYSVAFKGITVDQETKQITYKTLTKTQNSYSKITINKREDKINASGGTVVHLIKLNKQFQFVKEINFGERIYNTFYNLNDDLIINAKKNYLYRDDKLLPNDEISRFDNKIIVDHLIMNDNTELYNIEGDSIYLFNNHKFYNLTAAFGSSIDLQIRKIIYHDSTLYLSTFRNIYKCDNPLQIIQNKQVQLQLVDINYRNIHDLLVTNDSLYIASDDGLTIIPEAVIGRITTNIPLPYIQSILVNDEEAELSRHNVISTGNYRIKIIFSSINYSSTPVIYSYKLEGADLNWSQGIERIVAYQNLPPGNYIFKLRTSKLNTEWSNPVEFKITIKAHFWQHPLFLSGILILFLSFIFLAIIRRKNIQIKRRELDNLLITLEQKALQSMMNPHFIFNSLGSIQTYLLQNKSGEAGLYLSQFARLIRQNLNAINASSINLEEEIDRLKNYLDLEKLRMEEKFDYEIKVAENLETDEVLIPSMIIQPFVENAIWHGIAFLKQKGKIIITFSMQDDKCLSVVVEDNGIGMKRSETFSANKEKRPHLGMELARKRLDILGRKFSIKTSLKYSELFPGDLNPGTRVELIMPIGL